MIDTIWGVNTIGQQIEKLSAEAQQSADEEDEDEIECGACGETVPDAAFCSSCGAELEDEDEETEGDGATEGEEAVATPAELPQAEEPEPDFLPKGPFGA
jgi:uncharacterized OB-fold protein